MRNSVVLVLCQSPEPAAFPQLTHVKYLHTAHLVRCWEQIGTELLTQTAILFRACHASDYKSRRGLSITSVSRHHTLKRCYIYAYIHSCSSRAISCRQTRQSVVVRWVEGCQCSRHSLSQSVRQTDRQTDETDACSPLARSST